MSITLRDRFTSLTILIQNFFEQYAFGVCTRLGEKMGIATASIRLWFIYASFLTFGSPVIIYMILAFWMDIRKHLRRRSSIWDF
ncbi:MAG: PspC family transcriptional regulator [Bacteroidetes bacterium]|nr:PspC family transcriptional regulator [Bacteroidota bacterium]